MLKLTEPFFRKIIFCPNLASNSQVAQYNKPPILLQYLKKEVSDKGDFLHVDKNESFLQMDAMILMRMIKHSQSSQNSKIAMFSEYFKKDIKADFNILDIKVSYKVIASIKMGMNKYSQCSK